MRAISTVQIYGPRFTFITGDNAKHMHANLIVLIYISAIVQKTFLLSGGKKLYFIFMGANVLLHYVNIEFAKELA